MSEKTSEDKRPTVYFEAGTIQQMFELNKLRELYPHVRYGLIITRFSESNNWGAVMYNRTFASMKLPVIMNYTPEIPQSKTLYGSTTQKIRESMLMYILKINTTFKAYDIKYFMDEGQRYLGKAHQLSPRKVPILYTQHIYINTKKYPIMIGDSDKTYLVYGKHHKEKVNNENNIPIIFDHDIDFQNYRTYWETEWFEGITIRNNWHTGKTIMPKIHRNLKKINNYNGFWS